MRTPLAPLGVSCRSHAAVFANQPRTGRHIALCLITIAFALAVMSNAVAQVNVTTYHMDNARDGQNTGETLLTLSNVNSKTFGKVFSYNVDGFVVAQPLYVANVTIPGQGKHNVVYVVTQHDTVYAFDADNITSAPLWQVSFINPGQGITTVPIKTNGCPSVGYTEVGIMGTPVIDPTTGTLYVSAKTQEQAGSGFNYVHRLHALDITTGQEKFGGPVVVSGSWTPPGTSDTITFTPIHTNQRPGLLLLNGNVYVGYGSNGCDQFAYGFIFGFNASNLLQQTALFSPASSLEAFGSSIWQGGSGIAADTDGNIFVATANGDFDFNTGGPDMGDTILRMTATGPNGLSVADYFTPFDQANDAAMDLDVGSGGVVLLPDQSAGFQHVLVGAGKTGTVYVVNRDNMGGYNPANNDQIIQSLTSAVGPVFGKPVYWNNTVYFWGGGDALKAFPVVNGELTTPPKQSAPKAEAGPMSISANGATNGIAWIVLNPPNPDLAAYDAVKLTQLYNSTQGGSQNTLGAVAHFVTPMIANGRVYVGTQTQLVVYGLLPTLSNFGGNRQTGTAGTTLPTALTVKAVNPYTGVGISGVSVTFSDGGKGGVFNPPTVVTGASGKGNTKYTLPPTAGTYTITASGTGYTPATWTETATAGAVASLVLVSGGSQKATVGTTLPNAIVIEAEDSGGSGVAGVSINFTDNGAGGSFSSNPVITNAQGQASVSYTLPTKSGNLTIVASTASLSVNVPESAAAGAPTSIGVASGSRQSGPPNTALPNPLVAVVKDQFGNPVQGVSVSFTDNGAGGSFSGNPVITDGTGKATVTYTTGSHAGTVTINGSVSGISTPATFKESVT